MYKGERIDTGDEVEGYYFISPLTDENSGTESECGWAFLSDGIRRHCIADEDGVVYVVKEDTVRFSRPMAIHEVPMCGGTTICVSCGKIYASEFCRCQHCGHDQSIYKI
jgi:hypothetical protein